TKARRARAPDLHRFHKDDRQRQRSGADIDIDQRSLQQAAAALKKERIAAGFVDDERKRRETERERGQQCCRALLRCSEHNVQQFNKSLLTSLCQTAEALRIFAVISRWFESPGFRLALAIASLSGMTVEFVNEVLDCQLAMVSKMAPPKVGKT